jgi:cell wall-associated NlpC family hydrolase
MFSGICTVAIAVPIITMVSRSAGRLWFVALLCAPLLGACASAGPKVVAVPQPFPMPRGEAPAGTVRAVEPPPDAAAERPAAAPATPAAPLIASVVSTALELRGTPYRNGGTTPSGFDCSGFTQFVFAQYGLKLPREVRDQYSLGESVASQDIQPGDLLFFSTTAPGPSHVAIAIGDGRFVHAPSSRGVVRVEGLAIDYWARRFIGVRRLPLR